MAALKTDYFTRPFWTFMYVLNKYSYQSHAASTINYQALPVHAIVKAKSERI